VRERSALDTAATNRRSDDRAELTLRGRFALLPVENCSRFVEPCIEADRAELALVLVVLLFLQPDFQRLFKKRFRTDCGKACASPGGNDEHT